MKKEYQFIARVEKDPETGRYVGYIPGIPGVKSYHTFGVTLDELCANLKEVLELCLAEMTEEQRKEFPEFVGIQSIKVVI